MSENLKVHASFSRSGQLKEVERINEWDIVVIGGGATGLGIAVDAASRGFKTLLLEQSDFAKGTSSRSTKLVHGGVRYLANGDVRLVYDALKERAMIFKNAPHVSKKQSFSIPCYSWFSVLKYLIGLKLYDWMAGKHRIGRSSFVKAGKLTSLLGGINTNGLRGAVEYFDGQFDDARLAINLAQTAHLYGASLINYARVTALSKDSPGRINGLSFTDQETSRSYSIKAKAVINATGVFVDNILSMDQPDHQSLVRPSQGIHLVLDRSFLSGSSALMIPETSDGRVLFGVPWHESLILGTTDTPVNQHSLEPRALEAEVDFILKTAAGYLKKAPQREDVKSVFAGLRPLAAPKKDQNSTKEISRDHKLIISESGLVTITGGKWTTYRKMAEDAVNQAAQVGGFSGPACKTANLKIHGHALADRSEHVHLQIYGSDGGMIRQLEERDEKLAKRLHKDHPFTVAQVVWAARNEMARTVDDILARRLRILFLDAGAALDITPKVASILKAELKKDEEWERKQVEDFTKIARGYQLT